MRLPTSASFQCISVHPCVLHRRPPIWRARAPTILGSSHSPTSFPVLHVFTYTFSRSFAVRRSARSSFARASSIPNGTVRRCPDSFFILLLVPLMSAPEVAGRGLCVLSSPGGSPRPVAPPVCHVCFVVEWLLHAKLVVCGDVCDATQHATARRVSEVFM